VVAGRANPLPPVADFEMKNERSTDEKEKTYDKGYE